MEPERTILLVYAVTALVALAAFCVVKAGQRRKKKKEEARQKAVEKKREDLRKKFPYRHYKVVDKVIERLSATEQEIPLANPVPVWNGKHIAKTIELIPDGKGARNLLMLLTDKRVYLHYGLLRNEEQNEVMKAVTQTLGIDIDNI